MLERTARSVGELIAAVQSVAVTWTPSIIDPQELWFRGQPQSNFSLLPGLYRPEVERLNYDEVALFERFKIFARPHVRKDPADEWEWYFLAQHYGLPTRLLDWTESLLAAAYFAVCGAVMCRDRLAIDRELVRGTIASVFDEESPTVWILDAGTLNRAACGEDCPFVPVGDFTRQYLPDLINNPTRENARPLALLAPRANERLAAQQGVFTIHGHSREPIERSASANGVNLAKVVLDRANIAQFWDELQLTGVSRHSLFPGIDTAAEHVKWIMQSEKRVATN